MGGTTRGGTRGKEPGTGEALFLSRIFAIPKKGGQQLRPILDAREINNFVRKDHFKMEGLHTPRDMVLEGDRTAKIDLSDAYLTVPVHKESQRYLAFRWKDRTYVWTALPFGLTSAPRVFTKVMREVMKHLRARGICIIQYLDDLLILGRTADAARRDGHLVRETLEQLGFLVNDKKSVLEPSQTMEFLGFLVDSRDMTLSIPRAKVTDVRKDISCFVEDARKARGVVSVRRFAAVLGKLGALAPAMLPARLYLRPLQHAQKAMLRRKRNDWGACDRLSLELQRRLRDWRRLLMDWNGRGLIQPEVQLVIYTDASGTGWGAHLDGKLARGAWLLREKKYHSNVRELLAVER